MITEAAISLEEASLNQHDLNSIYNSIKTTIDGFIEKTNETFNKKIEKLASINELILSIISSDKSSISLEQKDSLIDSLRNQITHLKEKEKSYQKEITSLKNCLNQNMSQRYNGVSLEDSQIQQLKQKLRKKKDDYKIKELNYLLCINDQSKMIKELKKATEKYKDNEINEIRLFPYIVHNTHTHTNIDKEERSKSQKSKTNLGRNTSKQIMTVGNCTNYTFHTRKRIGIGTTEGNEECENEMGLPTETTNKDKVKRIIQDHHDSREAKSNKELINYKLHQKNRSVKQANQSKLKNNMLQISNMINNHHKKGYFKCFIPLLQKPVKTHYGSFK